MGWRFSKRIKLLPGVSLNISKSGVSLTLGGKGLSINIGPKHTTTTASLPGKGLSYRSRKKH
jgi:hypothetical protein